MNIYKSFSYSFLPLTTSFILPCSTNLIYISFCPSLMLFPVPSVSCIIAPTPSINLCPCMSCVIVLPVHPCVPVCPSVSRVAVPVPGAPCVSLAPLSRTYKTRQDRRLTGKCIKDSNPLYKFMAAGWQDGNVVGWQDGRMVHT